MVEIRWIEPKELLEREAKATKNRRENAEIEDRLHMKRMFEKGVLREHDLVWDMLRTRCKTDTSKLIGMYTVGGCRHGNNCHIYTPNHLPRLKGWC